MKHEKNTSLIQKIITWIVISSIFFIVGIGYWGSYVNAEVNTEVNTHQTNIPTAIPTITPEINPTIAPTEKPISIGKVTSVKIKKNKNSFTLSWKKVANAKKYIIERKQQGKYKEIATVTKNQYTDKTVKFETKYKYRLRAVSDEVYGPFSTEKETILKLKSTTLKGSRKGKNKVSLKWRQITGADGYLIYISNNRDKGYKPIQYIKSGKKVEYIKSGLDPKKQYYFKIKGYVTVSGKKKYSSVSNTVKIQKYIIVRINNKLKQLRKKYPIYSYWNHVGVSTKNKEISEMVTDTPCVHPYGYEISLTCNYYYCPNNVIGYQCYGFAWKLSDEIFGRNAKIQNHKSFKKAKIGDVIRYKGHSVIIIEKHKEYIKVAEANLNQPCMIFWDRIIWEDELKGAKYSTRY